ncbi:hypothetical protein M3P05_12405 [Sansalvadorimonas sp. 2012CJ34-2]|uniref:Uncharacterized protein n=1 Tax=Parendozoicomonas callyspongiae TaxID=2942213 RepID=A0ABT0PHJ0_9GAMM|nr:hypothetical protein [Sansalvadorimonas sp. 2012CJ34-2]MCL6270726.1 hypothetical protein [Sansalvadorimonas sp. 2012CJ34-2]
MAINKEDIKLYESQRLTDDEDGGGRATGTEVVDGQVNNLFRDISRIDRTVGDVSMRKVFAGVSTDNVDPYLGAHVILTSAPEDEKVGVVLFDTGSQTDERSDARNRIESYVVPSVDTSWDLLGNQLQGQRTLLAVQREQSRLPEIGEVYRLLNETSSEEQYVRITSVDSRVETFTYSTGQSSYVDFERRRLELGVSAPLEFTFPGGIPNPAGMDKQNGVDNTRVQDTQVADAARYYGIQHLEENANSGKLTFKVKSVYGEVVPSAQSETPLINQDGVYTARVMHATSGASRSVSLSFGLIGGNQSRAFLQSGAVPRTITLSIAGGTYKDNGDGTFGHTSGSNPFDKLTVDYESGQIDVWKSSGSFASGASASYRPGAVMVGDMVSAEMEITSQNRGFSYTFDLGAGGGLPEPGTLIISYLALGKWYDLTDAGNGVLEGFGTGTVDYASGAASATLQAMPDPDSAIVIAYKLQNNDEVTIHAGSVTPGQFEVRHITEKPGIKPGSVSITYQGDGNEKTITDNGFGILQGDGTGTVYYADGILSIVPETIPDAGTDLSLSYEEGTVTTINIPGTPDGAGNFTGTIPDAPLLPGSISLEWLVEREASRGSIIEGAANLDFTETQTRTAHDDGQGGWQDFTGTIDYASGAFTVKVAGDYQYSQPRAVRQGGGLGGGSYQMVYDSFTKAEVFPGDGVISKAQSNSLSHVPNTETITSPEITVDLLPLVSDAILPGSIIFTWAGETYFDRAGTLYKNISSQTNAGTAVGSVDYTGGLATFTDYPDGLNGGLSIKAMTTSRAGFQTSHIAFRTPGAPLRAGSLQVWANRADTGERISASSNFNGNIVSSEMDGFVDSETGWCKIHFTDGTNDIDVLPQTVSFNTVVLTSIPFDSSLIGLDPVRLPADGRVPIYRAGDVVVLAHTQSTDVGTPSDGQVININRNHQVSIAVVDSAGKALDPSQYTANLETGQVTFSSPLILQDVGGNALTGPFSVQDRIEQMSIVSDVQINGDISIIAPLAWDFPQGSTVSSAVVYGDLQARVKNEFSQRTWNSGAPNWMNSRAGDETTAQYNLINYPIQIDNKGAIEGKWALVFTGTSSFQIIEEKLGIIGAGSTSANAAPVNPETATPYWTVEADGWGSGWVSGNVLRFDTEGALAPLWLVRTVLAGQGTRQDDQFTLQVRGDAD